MAARAGRYPQEYRERLVELVRTGRNLGSLARQFEPSEQTIRNWVRQAEVDEGERSDGLTTAARQEMSRLKRENKRLRTERDILRMAAAWFAEGERIDPRRAYAFIRARQAEFPLAAICRVLGFSPSAYYDWLKRPPSARPRRDAELEARIGAIWTGSGETLGRPRGSTRRSRWEASGWARSACGG